MRTRNRKTKRQRTRNRKTKGGVFLFKGGPTDIMPELQRFADGKIKFLFKGGYGIVLSAEADESAVLETEKCGVNSIIVKIVSIGSPLNFRNTIETEKGLEEEVFTIKSSSITDLKREIIIQEDVREKSVKTFGCSIIPSILYAEEYTMEELMARFPNIAKNIDTTGSVGLIFMEHILHPSGETAASMGDVYHGGFKDYTITKYFPKARRLLIMLAKLGYLHNDFHDANILVSGHAVYIIDISEATEITPEQNELFKGYLDKFESGSGALELIEFLHGTKKTEKPGMEDTFLMFQWLRQNQIDEYVPGIDPSVKIATELDVISPLILSEEQKTRCVPAKTHFAEREAAREAARIAREAAMAAKKAEREAAMAAKKAEREAAMAPQEAARIERIAREADAEAARRKAYEAEREKETPEQRAAAEAAQAARDAAFAAEYGF